MVAVNAEDKCCSATANLYQLTRYNSHESYISLNEYMNGIHYKKCIKIN